jgi:RimJ/RimL family protein N-acetyltransferase
MHKNNKNTNKNPSYFVYKGIYCYLEQLTTLNDTDLFNLLKEHEKEYRFYVTDEPLPENLEDFRNLLREYFRVSREIQFVVYSKKDKKPVGTTFIYALNEESKSVKISAFFISEVRRTPLIAEALGATVVFAKEKLGIKEIKFDVYKENKDMLKIAEKVGALNLGEKESSVNPDRIVVAFKLPENVIESIQKKFLEFRKRKLKPR